MPTRPSNLQTRLKCRRRSDPMRDYDALPPELRAWLRQAALPWSPRATLRLWRKYCHAGGAEAAFRHLDRIEAGTLAKERRTEPAA